MERLLRCQGSGHLPHASSGGRPRSADIQVNAVCPGATRTALLEAIERAESGSAFDWMHTPQEVATEVLQLIAPWTNKPQGRVVAMKASSAVLGIPVQLD